MLLLDKLASSAPSWLMLLAEVEWLVWFSAHEAVAISGTLLDIDSSWLVLLEGGNGVLFPRSYPQQTFVASITQTTGETLAVMAVFWKQLLKLCIQILIHHVGFLVAPRAKISEADSTHVFPVGAMSWRRFG